ncbi:DUF6603 domain-containing protein [Fibrella arboris]|uniref:DUF6603 domain-containing protein n=1 Tax=Fibrella arboris TaxID=3242486 RepID=UPI00352125F0
MPTQAGTVAHLTHELGKALQPLATLLQPDFTSRLGLQLPSSVAANAAVMSAFSTAATTAGQLPALVTNLGNAIAADNVGPIGLATASLISAVNQLIAHLKAIGTQLSAAAVGLPASERAAIDQLAGTLASRTIEYMLIGYLDQRLPALTTTLSMLGLIDKEMESPSLLETQPVPETRLPRRFYVDRIGLLLQHPDQLFQQAFGLGDAAFDGQRLFSRLQHLLTGFGLPSTLINTTGQPLRLDATFFHLQVDPTVNPPGITWGFHLPGELTRTDNIPISDLWKGTLSAEAAFVGGLSGTLRPPFSITAQPPSGNLKLTILAGIRAEKPGDERIILIGDTGGTRLQAKTIGGSVGIDARLGTSGSTLSPAIQFRVDEGKLIIDFSKGDGFIKSLLSGVRFEAAIELLGTWSPTEGLRLQGSGGVEVFIPMHLDLAIIQVQGLYISIGFSTAAPLKLGVAAQFSTNLGPLKAVVDHIGTDIPISFPAGGGGNLGFANIDFAFSPPNGIGLSLDGGGFKGGGFLKINVDKGEYAGVLELEFQSLFSVKAIGILNTKMPDGSPGFSLIILITAEFPPIQLGFGFTLLGVGGLLGLNRTMVVERLAAGVKDGSLNYILFPTDVVANAPTIIASIGAIFPPRNGQFVFGPMGKLGWGTPTLITVELGLLIEVANPVRIAILGVIRCLLPEEHLPLIKIQVNFIGVLDFEKKQLFFFASIYDSRLLAFTLAGDMLLLINWSANANFVLSVGGFHPAFTPPPMGLPALTRLTIALLDGDNPRLRLEAYFAITANTVQFGAKLELYASVAIASIEGFLAFDVLIQFSPFHFIARIQAALSAKIAGVTLFAVGLDLTLEGPSLWRAYGSARVSVSFLFFSVSATIKFDVSWGDRTDTSLPPVNVLPRLVTALGDKRNWQALIPANSHQQVSLRERPADGPDADKLIVHPFGILTVSQKLVPLNIDIQLLGNQQIADNVKTFRVEHVRDSNGHEFGLEAVKEQFAVAQFVKMDDAAKLSRKAFEQLDSGILLAGSNRFMIGFAAVRTIRYDFKYLVKKKLTRALGKLRYLRAELFTTLLNGNAVAQSSLSMASRSASPLAPPVMAVKPEQYVVSFIDSLAPVTATPVFDDEASAHAAMQTVVRDNPGFQGTVQVVSAYQLAL